MDSKRHFAGKLAVSLMAIVILVCMSGALLVYRKTLQTDLSVVSCETLHNILEQQRFTFSSKMQDQKSALQTYADSLEYAEDLEEEVLLEKLRLITKNSTFDYVSYVSPDGDTLENTGMHLNVADRDYFKRALAGETVIANPVKSKVTGKNIVTFATPILRDGEITAVLAGIYDTENFSKILLPLFDGKGYTYITTTEGEIIIKTDSSRFALYSNIFDAMQDMEFYELDSKAAVKEKISKDLSGHSRFLLDGERRRLHYAPVGVNNWYIFTVAPDSVIAPHVMDIMSNTTFFMAGMTFLSVLILVYLFIVQKNHLKELNDIAYVDSLTGASNRKSFKLKAEEILKTADTSYAFLLLDIDKFKVLNDTFGYGCGDLVLINIANIIRKNLKGGEIFGRCESDEFFLLVHYTDDKTLEDRALTLIGQIETQFKTQISDSYRLVICVGINVISNHQESVNSICDRARHAHRLIKGMDESGVSFYDEEIRNKILEEKEVENKMHAALRNNEFLLYLQPKYYLDNESIYGVEALVRWKKEDFPIIYPDKFIPVFEKDGFITKLDMYMLEKSCQTIRGWIDEGIEPIPVSINFSRLHLKNSNFVEEIFRVVEQYEIPPELIEVELTESTMLNNEEVLVDMLSHLHERGLTLSMDDFGSGYSSLGLLKNLPVDVIKLDRTFFVDYCELDRAVTVVSGIISMAKKLGIKTVAEGVETKEQILFLKELGCDIVQGYYYAKPMAVAELTEILKGTARL